MNADRTPRVARAGLWPVALALVALLASASHSEPLIWDQDEDAIDDRIETVNLLGFKFSFENADTLLRQRVEVTRGLLGSLDYGVYVVYDRVPTDADLDLCYPQDHRARLAALKRPERK